MAYLEAYEKALVPASDAADGQLLKQFLATKPIHQFFGFDKSSFDNLPSSAKETFIKNYYSSKLFHVCLLFL